ncbi:MAG: hypothetical protein ACKO04_01610 [Actinomycetes bacterium]
MTSSTEHLQPADLHTQLGAWVAAGLIDDEQAGQILAFEGGSASRPPLVAPPVPAGDGAAPAVAPTAAPWAGAAADGRPGVAPATAGRTVLAVEVVAYLGAALIVAAVMGILGQTWEDVPLAGRLALVGVPTAAAAGAGWVLRTRTGPLGRLASVLWLLAVGGAAAFVALVCADGTDVVPDTAATITLGVVAPLAVLAWAFQQRSLQMLAMVGTTTGLVASSLHLAGVESAATIGAVVVALGLAWFAQARVPLLGPALAGTFAGLVAAYAGAQAISTVWGVAGTALIVLGAVGLMVLSIVDHSTPELLLGAFALFTSLPRLLFEWFPNSIGAPLALLVCGVVLVLVALRVAATRRGHDADGRPMSRPTDS